MVVVLVEEMTTKMIFKRAHNGGGARVTTESKWKFLMRICMERIRTIKAVIIGRVEVMILILRVNGLTGTKIGTMVVQGKAQDARTEMSIIEHMKLNLRGAIQIGVKIEKLTTVMLGKAQDTAEMLNLWMIVKAKKNLVAIGQIEMETRKHMMLT